MLYVPSHTARDLHEDLQRAGIAKQNDEGKIDFHALRTAFATVVVESGANPKEAQTLLRHSDPRITMNMYAKARPHQLQAKRSLRRID